VGYCSAPLFGGGARRSADRNECRVKQTVS
jgi:hypothetical protein